MSLSCRRSKRGDTELASLEPAAPFFPVWRVVWIGKPAHAQDKVEIRDLEKSKIDLVFGKIKSSADKIAADTGTTISLAPLNVTAIPAPTDRRLRKVIQEAATGLGLTTKLMPSGAGHGVRRYVVMCLVAVVIATPA